ncbi:MAG: two-component system sensor histidine kinase PilS [Gammaproteobacteria bacterium]|nr:MAG: two-component system sensor histidine kinase PilS [Gammaproteobacteria bacterium]
MRKPGQYIFSSRILSDSTPREGTTEYWRSLFYLNLYRMLLAVFLSTASLTSVSVGSLGSRHPELFIYTSFSYAFLSLLFAFLIHYDWPGYIIQCRLQILVDIIITILLYNASSGRGSGIEILFFITVSASGILLGGRAALITASTATILLILEHFYEILINQRPPGGFTSLGFIGSGLFITAFIIYYLTLLLRKTEIEIAEKNITLQKMGHINQLIVEQLESGIIVVDQSSQVILFNNSARELLTAPDSLNIPLPLDSLLNKISLDDAYFSKISHEKESKIELPSGKTILTRYRPLGDKAENGYLILFDDYSQIEKEKRNEKFIAMGRLSASIAHEIRNPLGAICHAGQLLAESPGIYKENIRLVEIIEGQSRRIDQIIKTVLGLGQQNEQKLQKIPIHDWLDRIINDFTRETRLTEDSILLSGDCVTSAYGDPDQLRQVIQNLLTNSLRYADTSKSPIVMIDISENTSGEGCTIKLSDNGPGIDRSIQDKVFEPFFTTSSTGNGLGLFIARKICLSNGASLEYIHIESGNGYFVLTLADKNTYHRLKNHQQE